MQNIILLILLIMFLNSCKKDEQGNIQNQVIEKPVKDSLAKDTIPAEKILEGIYSLNQNSNIFRSCQYPDSTYWINDETKKLKGMYEKIYSAKNVYSSVIVKIKGEIVKTENDRVKDKYPMTINVSEVIDMSKKNSDNTCISYDFWAQGNDPNWSLQISKNENLIEFDDFSENKSYYFFYEEPVEKDGKIIYASHNNIQLYTIKAEITKETCTNNITGDIFDYSVKVELGNGKLYKGCGIKGKE